MEVNQDWIEEERRWVETRQRNYNRIMRAVKALKGDKYAKELEEFIGESGLTWDFKIVREPVGDYQEEGGLIPGSWVDQRCGYSGDDYSGYQSILIKPGRWFQWHYEC